MWKDLLDAAKTFLPGNVILGAVACACVYFAVYYANDYRTPAHALADRTFLTAVIAIAAGVVIHGIVQLYDFFGKRVSVVGGLVAAVVLVAGLLVLGVANLDPPSSGKPPLLVIPLFRDDNGVQIQRAFGSRIEAALAFNRPRGVTVKYLNSYLEDQPAAVKAAKRYGAVAVVHSPTVVEEDKTKRCCFRLTLVDQEATTTYAPFPPMEAKCPSLDAIVQSILAGEAATSTPDAPVNPLLTRLDSLEKAVARLESGLQAAQRGSPVGRKRPAYAARRAVVVGCNTSGLPNLSLQSAESDAERVAARLTALGFSVQKVIGTATRQNILAAIQDRSKDASAKDLFVFYYSGSATTLGGRQELQFVTSDFGQADSAPFLINQLKEEVGKLPVAHKVCILDTCWGTGGLSVGPVTGGAEAAQRTFEFVASSQDDQTSAEGPDGGKFTIALLKALQDDERPAEKWLDAVFARASELLREASIDQRPKLVRLGGTGEIYLGK